jgi:hypothetical protein
MKSPILIKALLMAASLPLLASCVHRQVVYRDRPVYAPPPPGPVIVERPPLPPPPPPAEYVTVAPGPPDIWVWIPGAWEWRGRWVWTGGHWAARPHRGARWVAPHWEHRPRGHVWIGGYWR